MERGPNDHIGPETPINSPAASAEGVKAHLLDIYQTLGVEWGKNPFPAIDALKAGRLTIEAIARTCYAVNAVYCRDIGDTPRDWEECRASVISGVERALAGATPEQLHDAWCQFQEAAGWVYGEVKDPVAKLHPCLVPYDQLESDQRTKDQFFLAIVESLRPYLP